MQYRETTPGASRQRFNKATGDTVAQTAENIGNDLLSGNVTGAINETISAITTAIKGRAYTTGKYKLAEKYMDYVLGRTDITSQAKVPDNMINPAIDFFTRAFGIPITTIEDLDVIDPRYTVGDNVTLYKTTRDPLYKQIPDSQVAQAVKVKSFLPYKEQGGPPTWNFNSAYQQAGINTSGNTATNSTTSSGGGLISMLFGNPAPGSSTTGVGGASGMLIVIIVIVVLIVIILLIVRAAKK